MTDDGRFFFFFFCSLGSSTASPVSIEMEREGRVAEREVRGVSKETSMFVVDEIEDRRVGVKPPVNGSCGVGPAFVVVVDSGTVEKRVSSLLSSRWLSASSSFGSADSSIDSSVVGDNSASTGERRSEVEAEGSIVR